MDPILKELFYGKPGDALELQNKGVLGKSVLNAALKVVKRKQRLKNIIGWTAVILILIAYLGITIEIFRSESLLYNVLNFLGGSFLAWRVYQDKNYSNFILEIIFVLIAIIGILKSIL